MLQESVRDDLGAGIAQSTKERRSRCFRSSALDGLWTPGKTILAAARKCLQFTQNRHCLLGQWNYMRSSHFHFDGRNTPLWILGIQVKLDPLGLAVVLLV